MWHKKLNYDFVYSKILNNGLHSAFKQNYLINILNQFENSGLKSRYFVSYFQFYLLNVEANLPETSPFFVCPNGFGEHLFFKCLQYFGCITLYMVFLRGYVMSNHLAGYLKFNSSIVYNVYLLSSLGFFTDTKGGVDHSRVSAVTTEH